MNPSGPTSANWVNALTRAVLSSGLARLSPVTVYLMIATPVLLWFFWSTIFFPLFTYGFDEDLWEHSAAIKEWKSNLWAPRNPHLDIDAGSPRYMPFFFALTVMAKLIDLKAIDALKFAGVFNLLILFTGIFLFFRTYFRNDFAPVLGLVILLGVWGTGWRHSGEYQLRSLFYVASYPSTFAFALSLVTLWIATNGLRGATTSRLWLYAALPLFFAIIFLSHPLTGAFALGATGVLSVTEREARFVDRVKIVLMVIVGVTAAELWPYFSVWGVVLGSSVAAQQGWVQVNVVGGIAQAERVLWTHDLYNPSRVLYGLGPALIGIPCVLYLARQRAHLFIVVGCLVMLGIYWSRLFLFQGLPIWVGGRFLLFVTFFLHLALVAVILGLGPYWQLIADGVALPLRAKLLTDGLAVFLVACVLWSAAFAAAHFGYTYLWKRPVTEILRPLARAIPDNAVVLARSKVAWPIPTFAGKVVSLLHANPLVPDLAQREHDVALFFDATTENKNRSAILRRYNVSHVLIAPASTPKNVVRFLAFVGEVKSQWNGYILVELDDLLIYEVDGE